MKEKRVVLITGGGSGIGKACAKLFYKDGATVFILGRTEEKLKEACREIRSEGHSETEPGEEEQSRIGMICADVSRPSECREAVDAVIRSAGQLDVLVNCAGVSKSGPSAEVTEEIWDWMIDTNLKGTFFMIRYALPELQKNRGSVVNISSDAGVVGNREMAVYCASKGGVTVMTKSLALELAPLGIRVNAVCPTEVDTPMLERDAIEYGYRSREEYEQQLPSIYPQEELARFVRPEEVAESVLFLADSRKAGAITGTALMIDFGITAGY